jgi:hypothetical protein
MLVVGPDPDPRLMARALIVGASVRRAGLVQRDAQRLADAIIDIARASRDPFAVIDAYRGRVAP